VKIILNFNFFFLIFSWMKILNIISNVRENVVKEK